jgi:general stress protein YciG
VTVDEPEYEEFPEEREHKSHRGFARLPREQVREIARKGGKAHKGLSIRRKVTDEEDRQYYDLPPERIMDEPYESEIESEEDLEDRDLEGRISGPAETVKKEFEMRERQTRPMMHEEAPRRKKMRTA